MTSLILSKISEFVPKQELPKLGNTGHMYRHILPCQSWLILLARAARVYSNISNIRAALERANVRED